MNVRSNTSKNLADRFTYDFASNTCFANGFVDIDNEDGDNLPAYLVLTANEWFLDREEERVANRLSNKKKDIPFDDPNVQKQIRSHALSVIEQTVVEGFLARIYKAPMHLLGITMHEDADIGAHIQVGQTKLECGKVYDFKALPNEPTKDDDQEHAYNLLTMGVVSDSIGDRPRFKLALEFHADFSLFNRNIEDPELAKGFSMSRNDFARDILSNGGAEDTYSIGAAIETSFLTKYNEFMPEEY